MYRVYDKGNGINFIWYDESNNDKAKDLVMWQCALYPLVVDCTKMAMDLSCKMVEWVDFYFGTNN